MKGYAVGVALAACAVLVTHSVQGSDGFRLLRLDGHYVKWGGPDLGTGATVRYAIVAGPMDFPGARNCQEMAPLDPLARASDIVPSVLHREVAAAFAMWQAAANITFEASDDPRTAQILIGTQGNPRGWAFADVLYDRVGDAAAKRIDKALICLNAEKAWKVGFGGDARAYDLRYAIAHEIGHAIGLNHPGPTGQLMSFEYGEGFRTLQPGDLSGAIALYGIRGAPEPVVPPSAVADDTPTMALRGRPNDRR